MDCVLSVWACFFLNIGYIAWIDVEFREMDEYSTFQMDLNTTWKYGGVYFFSDELLKENSAYTCISHRRWCFLQHKLSFLKLEICYFLIQRDFFFCLDGEKNVIELSFEVLSEKHLFMEVLQSFKWWFSILQSNKWSIKGFSVDAPLYGLAC